MNELKFEPKASEIFKWLQEKIATELECAASDIQPDIKLTSLSLDSIILVTLSADLGEWSNCFIDPTIFWEFETIHELVEWLINQSRSEEV